MASSSTSGCIICKEKCHTFAASIDSKSICECGHGLSCHQKRSSVTISSKNFVASNMTKRRSERLEFWQKLEESKPAAPAEPPRRSTVSLNLNRAISPTPKREGAISPNPLRDVSPAPNRDVSPAPHRDTLATPAVPPRRDPSPAKATVVPPVALNKAMARTDSPATLNKEAQASKSHNESQDSPRKSQRELVLGEFLDTEQQYVDDLNILIQNYLIPLRAADLIVTGDIQAIFSNVETIFQFNMGVLTEFNTRKKANPNPIIGDIIKNMSAYFKMYTAYCANHDNALKTLEKVKKKDPAISKFFDEQKSKSKSLNCEGYLIKPIQRLCKYPLLLRELIKNTPEGHEDYCNLTEAQKSIEAVVTYVNEGRRNVENQQKIIEIQESFDAPDLNLVSPSRKLLMSGKLQIGFGKKIARERKIYLFNDLILIRRSRTTPIQVLLSNTNLIEHADSETVKNLFELTTKETNETICLISFNTVDEKASWYKEIKKLLEGVKKKNLEEAKRKASSNHIKSEKENPPDSWFVGLLLYQKFSGRKLYENATLGEMLDSIQNRKTPTIPDDFPQSITEILQLCWNVDPAKRPSFSEVQARLDGLSDNSNAPKSTKGNWLPAFKKKLRITDNGSE